jgi:hypothetical protein
MKFLFRALNFVNFVKSAGIVLSPDEMEQVNTIAKNIVDNLYIAKKQNTDFVFEDKIKANTLMYGKTTFKVIADLKSSLGTYNGSYDTLNKIIYVDIYRWQLNKLSKEELFDLIVIVLSHELVHAKDLFLDRVKFKSDVNVNGTFNDEEYNNFRKLLLGIFKQNFYPYVGINHRIKEPYRINSLIKRFLSDLPYWNDNKNYLTEEQKNDIFDKLSLVAEKQFLNYDTSYNMSEKETNASLMEALIFANKELPIDYNGLDVQNVVDLFIKKYKSDYLKLTDDEIYKQKIKYYKFIVKELPKFRNKEGDNSKHSKLDLYGKKKPSEELEDFTGLPLNKKIEVFNKSNGFIDLVFANELFNKFKEEISDKNKIHELFIKILNRLEPNYRSKFIRASYPGLFVMTNTKEMIELYKLIATVDINLLHEFLMNKVPMALCQLATIPELSNYTISYINSLSNDIKSTCKKIFSKENHPLSDKIIVKTKSKAA